MTTPAVVKTVMRIVGGATVGALVLAGGYGFASSLAHTERTQSGTVDSDGISTIVVRTEVGDIEVVQTGAGSGEIELSTERRGSWRLPDVEQRREGDTLVVEALCQGSWWGDCATDVVLRVPPGLAVVLRSEVGTIVARGEFTDVSMESSAGELRGERLRADSVTATTSVGEIDLELSAPARSVDATSSVGEVTVVVPDDGTKYAVQVRTDTGEGRTDVPRDSSSPYSITATSSVGDARVLVARQ